MHRRVITAPDCERRPGANKPYAAPLFGWRRLLLVMATLAALGLTPLPLAAQDAVDPPVIAPSTYVVQPGDTLAGISERYGLAPAALATINGIQNPRQLYPGQALSLPSSVDGMGSLRPLGWGEDLVTLSRAAGMTPQALARANRLLRPTGLVPGYPLWIPSAMTVRPFTMTDPSASMTAPRVGAAIRAGARLWDVLWLNPLPQAATQPLLVPSHLLATGGPAVPPERWPAWVTSLTLSRQPVDRGETVVVAVETAEPVSCVLSYLDQTEACVGNADPTGRRWLGLVGLPALQDPGMITLTLTLTASEDRVVDIPLPILVAAGRYDYERIDLPPDRQSLLDPGLSQDERDKIAALRLLRSPVRFWSYPFSRPVDAAITSYYGSRRSYGYGFASYHAGSDFDGLGGEPVLAPAAGVVVLAEPLVVRGNAVMVDHGWGVVSGFWHLSEITVEVGERVVQGQSIGALGNTGLSTGAHLHWELWVNGSAVNALSWLEPDGPAALLGATP